MSEKSYSKRSANFNSCEIDFLIKTITRYRDIIESKKIDRASAEEKAKAWKNVEREYNSQFDYNFRSAKVLKTKYDNLKKNAKRIIRQRDSDVSMMREEKCPKLDEIAFMDETQFSTDKLLSETVREYFEENFPENDNTSSSWHANEAEDADDSDDQEEMLEKDRYTASDSKRSLLVPMFNKSFQNTRNNISTSNCTIESRSSEHEVQEFNSSLEDIKNPISESKFKKKSRPLQNEAGWELTNSNSTKKKSSIQLFCDSLAMQIDEAQLTPYQLSSLQIDLLKKMQEYLPTDK